MIPPATPGAMPLQTSATPTAPLSSEPQAPLPPSVSLRDLLKRALAYRWDRAPRSKEDKQLASQFWRGLTPLQQNEIKRRNARKRRMNPDMLELKRFIREVRLAEGLSQEKFSLLLGVTRRSVVKWENASGSLPYWSSLKKIILLHRTQEKNRKG